MKINMDQPETTTSITEENKVQTSILGLYTITKDFEKYTVLITKVSKRSRFGTKVICHYTYKNITDLSKRVMQMNLYVDKFIFNKKNEENEKLLKKKALTEARKNFESPYYVGQILYNSWGYEQTNVDFYQIVKVEKKIVVVRELEQERTQTNDMAGQTMPVKDKFIGDEIRKIVQIRIYNNKTITYVKKLSFWDGRSIGWSSYH